MGKMDQIILTVPNKKLFEDSSNFEWFKVDSNILQNINNHSEWYRRGDAEVDFERKQPISYAVFINKEMNAIWLYKRADNTKGGTNGETRLNNKYSAWIWGHIEQVDISENILEYSLKREIEEEITLVNWEILSLENIWFINSEKDEVSKVHIGVLYVVKTNSTEITPNDWEIAYWKFIKLEDVKSYVESQEWTLEAWTEIVIDTLLKK